MALPDLSFRLCMGQFCFAYAYMLLLYIPLAIAMAWLIKKSFVRFKNKKEVEDYEIKHKANKRLMMITRPIIMLFIFIALATPFTTEEVTVEGDPSLILLVDNSTSFDLFDRSIVDDVYEKLKRKMPVEIKYIGYGEESAIGDGILNYVQGDDNVLVITDGQNNKGRDIGDMVLFASKLNTTISALSLEPVKSDIAVSLDGPSEVIQDTENTFEVRVSTVGSPPPYRLEVTVDGQVVVDRSNGKTHSFTQKFSEGYHRMTAKAYVNDNFNQNNIYYKTIRVVPRPKVLFVSEKSSPMYEAIRKVYASTSMNTLPDDFNEYPVIILNDLSADRMLPWMDRLTNYVSEGGNGLLVVGGESSYNKGFYKDSLVEALLPVQVGTGRRTKESDINIAMVMDISGSTGMGFSYGSGSAKIDVEKALTIGIFGDILPEHRVAVIAFNQEAYMVSPLSTLGEKKDLTNRILTLQDGGGTFILAGLKKAEFAMFDAKGSKNVILISDGVTMAPEEALKEAERLAKQGIKVYTVGVGKGTTDVVFMKNLAEKGNGVYFEPDQHERLRIFFGEEPEQKEKAMYGVMLLDSSHFITKNIELSASITGLNFVLPKTVAKPLAVTDDNSPILTVWRFGLGRVASLTTDDGNKWGGSLLAKGNSDLIIRAINWAIGDLSRKKNFDVDVKDTYIDRPVVVEVVSDDPPKASGLEFSKADNRLFTANINAKRYGFDEIMGAAYAVNYNTEYRSLGMNPALDEMAMASGGKMFKPEEIDTIVDDVKTFSKRTKVDIVNYRWPFLLIATIMVVADIVVRRIRENRMRKV